ncbi:hypothetical protein AVEN_81075-1 [Araneus ventricosus]|uniref:Uncharacterized protein n=1 Tax=Araneus ventricosus TaxID=182803 RepID=A0A4Y2M5K4_ARAVE|nr:hypothetical protein AVEN_81075-1 [Araneus ventricosus]
MPGNARALISSKSTGRILSRVPKDCCKWGTPHEIGAACRIPNNEKSSSTTSSINRLWKQGLRQRLEIVLKSTGLFLKNPAWKTYVSMPSQS